jgi:hypothetical protein
VLAPWANYFTLTGTAGATLVGGLGLALESEMAPFAVAGSSLLLLVSGIYRTWGETLALIGSRE